MTTYREILSENPCKSGLVDLIQFLTKEGFDGDINKDIPEDLLIKYHKHNKDDYSWLVEKGFAESLAKSFNQGFYKYKYSVRNNPSHYCLLTYTDDGEWAWLLCFNREGNKLINIATDIIRLEDFEGYDLDEGLTDEMLCDEFEMCEMELITNNWEQIFKLTPFK